jgi:sugar/nucleoside kinase (ribokinase family)
MIDCAVVGDAMWDVIVKSSLTPKRSLAYCSHISIHPGGSANVSAGITCLGGSSAFIGKVGRDSLGDFYLSDLKSRGIESCIFKDEEKKTGIVVSMVDESGERSFLVFRGANDALNPDEVESVSDVIRKARYLYVCGFSLINKPQREAILKAVDIAIRFGVKIIFDPAVDNLTASLRRIFAKIIDKCSVLSPNLSEARALCMLERIDDIVSYFRHKVPLLALKLGSAGCILARGDKTIRAPAFKVKCIDTTGAGDAFVAALTYGLCREYPIETIATLANWFASRVITSYGPRSYPQRDDVENFLESLK